MFHSGPTWGIKDEERMGKLLCNCFKILGKGWQKFYTIALKKQSAFFVDHQNGSEMYKWYQVLVQDLDENVDENVLNCKVVEKSGNPPSLHQPPFSGLSPLSRTKFHTPKLLKFWKVLHPSTFITAGVAEGGGRIATMNSVIITEIQSTS